MISEPVLVGMRTDSAMKPMLAISGITRLRALAAPVVVRMMLFMMLRFLRRSVLPAAGSRSSTCWLPVAAWTVAIEADRIRWGPKWLSSGRIMCARQVVVHEALEISR